MAENEDYIRIKVTTYEKLLKARKELRALEVHGVDNWEGYGEAMAELYGDEEDE